MKKPELLIPAGSLEVLKTAGQFWSGCSLYRRRGVWTAGKGEEFFPGGYGGGIAYAHDRGVKVYVTANILAHNGDLEAASDYFMELKHLKTKDGRSGFRRMR